MVFFRKPRLYELFHHISATNPNGGITMYFRKLKQRIFGPKEIEPRLTLKERQARHKKNHPHDENKAKPVQNVQLGKEEKAMFQNLKKTHVWVEGGVKDGIYYTGKWVKVEE